MKETKKDLLVKFKKANKTRRQVLAERNGYTTWQEYLSYLEGGQSSSPKIKGDKGISKKVPTDIVIAFDTTGSMRSYIAKVKQHVVNLIPTIFKNTKNVRISIVAFGDYYDMTSKQKFGKAYQVIDLTNDQSDLIDFINNTKDTFDQDSNEFYELVIKKVTEETSWREGSNRSLLLIGDDEPHDKHDYINSYSCASGYPFIDWKEEAVKAANLGIKIDTLSIHGDSWYKELAKMTGGIYAPFSSSNKTDKLVEGYAYARSGSTAAFASYSKSVMDSGDVELIGLTKVLATI